MNFALVLGTLGQSKMKGGGNRRAKEILRRRKLQSKGNRRGKKTTGGRKPPGKGKHWAKETAGAKEITGRRKLQGKRNGRLKETSGGEIAESEKMQAEGICWAEALQDSGTPTSPGKGGGQESY